MSTYRHYTLDDAAKELGISVNQILQNAEEGKITLCFRSKVADEAVYDYKELTEQDGDTYLTTVAPDYASKVYELGEYINLTPNQSKELAIKKHLIAADLLPPPESDLYISHDSRLRSNYQINIDDIVIQHEALEAFNRKKQEETISSKPEKLNAISRYKKAKKIKEQHHKRFEDALSRKQIWAILHEYDSHAFTENGKGDDAFFKYHNTQSPLLFSIKSKSRKI